MSLFPEEPRRSGSSRSRSRDRRSKDKDDSVPETPSSWTDIREPSYVYPEDDFDDRYKSPAEHSASGALPYPEEGGIYSMLPGDQALYSYDQPQPTYKTVSPTDESSYRHSRTKPEEKPPGAFPEDDRGGKDEARIRTAEPRDDKYGRKPYDSKPYDSKPYDSKPYDSKPYDSKPYDSKPYDSKPYDSKPYDSKPYESKPYESKPYESNPYESKPYESKPYESEQDKLKYLPQKYARTDEKEDEKKKKKEEEENKLQYLPQKYIRKVFGGDDDSDGEEKKERKGKDKYDDDLAYGKPPVPIRPKKEKTDLAYGKATGVSSTSGPSGQPEPATYGSYIPSGGQWDDKRTSQYGAPQGGPDPRQMGSAVNVYDARNPQDDRYSQVPPGAMYSEDPRNPRGDKYAEDPRNPRGDKYPEDSRGSWPGQYPEDPRAPQDDRYPQDPRAPRDERYPEDPRAPRDDRYPQDPRAPRDDRYPEDPRAPRDERYSEEPRAPRDERYPEDPRASRDERYGEDPRGSNPNVLTVDPSSRDKDRSRDRRKDKESRDTLTVEGSSRREKSRDRSRDRRRDKSPGPRSSGDTLTVDSGSKRHREKSRDRKRDKSPAPDTLMVDSGRKDRDRSRDRRRDKSPQPPTRSSLTVDSKLATGRLAGMTVAMAPASPLLESYYGTYQDMSPMPSPLLLASQNPSDDTKALDALSSLSGDEGDSKKKNRRARFHDPEDITTQLANALKGSKAPDTQPLIHILPSLTHEQVMELRTEYKRMVKTGSERKGVNVAKHIRARLKDEDPLLMKACYAVALGKWESEAYWANFWYQGDKTRRELLIEALMGRTNYEVACIKDAFTDKKYDNSLTKCMKTELKEDKFKKAVLMVLEERRMEEYDHYGRREPLDYELVDQDADDLRKAVKSEKGGESSMISIVIQRSDPHLRAVLKEYEHHYRSNFARDALKKSGNLVGELLAHILNGVINRPVRDALLLHHAISASRKDGLRRELLISRLVRYHWDPHHMNAVKRAYRERYGKDLQEAVREVTSGQWGMFCRELCIARMPDDVRQVERVADIRSQFG